MKYTKAAFIVLFTIIPNYISHAQQTPYNPVSSQVYTPFIINPAISGSKDYTTIDLSATIQGDDMSQLLSSNTRITTKGADYFGAPITKNYTNYGVGATLFNDHNGSSVSTGVSAAFSYHIQLDKKRYSFLSAGIAVKGIRNVMDSIADLEAPIKKSFIPNIDAGLYFYSNKIYAGISVTNILGNMIDSTDMATYNIPISRQYFFYAGYKFVISKPLNIVLEPSIIVNLSDSLRFDAKEAYNPMLKLYMEAFCIGVYLNDFENMNFFFQYKFPKLYIGTLISFPRNVPFYKEDLTVEIAAGVNFNGMKNRNFNRYQW